MGDVLTKRYRGTEKESSRLFDKDAADLSGQDYYPVNQNWIPGSRGCATFIGAILIGGIFGFVVTALVGIAGVFIGILIAMGVFVGSKPAGSLTVTYERTPKENLKTCPNCAEEIKAAAKVCRFCRSEFEE